jgi:ATP-dependent Clp protease ATP-binding subunit ClpC
VLEGLGVDAVALRTDLVRRIDAMPGGSHTGEIAFAPAAQYVLQHAYAEARSRGDEHIGTEHILLGLVRVGEGGGHELLAGRGVTLESARAELDRLGPGPSG